MRPRRTIQPDAANYPVALKREAARPVCSLWKPVCDQGYSSKNSRFVGVREQQCCSGGIGGAWKLSLARVVPLRQIAVGIHEAAQPLVETVIACPVCVLAVVLFFVLFGVSK